MIDNIKRDLKRKLEQTLNLKDIVIEVPKKGDSDLAIPLFSYVKLLGKSMNDVFESFKLIIDEHPFVEKVYS